jgi:hypothetical protein
MRILVTVLATALLAATALGADPEKEKYKPTREVLDAVFNDHGEKFIPVPNHRDAIDGYIFNIDKQTLGVLPIVPKSVEATPDKIATWLVETMRKQKTGDLFYNVPAKDKPGVLIVVSGKVRDLGTKYIFDFHNKVIDSPADYMPKGVPVPGYIEDPKPGHVYVMQTVFGTHAIFRVIAAGSGGIQIQWVASLGNMTDARWQLPGSMTSVAENIDVNFHAMTQPARVAATLPKNDPVPAMGEFSATRMAASITPTRAPEERSSIAALQPATLAAATRSKLLDEPIRPTDPSIPGAAVAPGRVAAILRDRENAIQLCLVTLAREGKTPKDKLAKAQAMSDLGNLHATEAIGPLILNIAHMDPNDTSDDAAKLYPAVGALVRIGKPSTTAAIKALHDPKLGGAGGGNPLNTPENRTTLLTYVILHIEGPEIAEFLLTKELEKAKASQKIYFEQAIRSVKTEAGTP